MDLTPITGHGDAVSAIAGFCRTHGAAAPLAAYDAMNQFYPSNVDRIVSSTEALYAIAKSAPAGDMRDDACSAAARLAAFATVNGWQELGQTERGAKIVGACQRIAGEGVQPEIDDPAPQAGLGVA